jgi:uncharacterized BrkB/YihY/UPF0761 family membrane protein
VIWLRRFLIFFFWTAGTFVLLGVLIFLFVFGDCKPGNAGCLAFKEGAARWTPVAVACLYGIGLGVFLQRWFLNKAR